MLRRLTIRGTGFRQPNPWMPARLADGGPMVWIGANAAVAVVYFLLGATVSQFFAAYGLFPAPIWLPAGVAIVAAMIGEMRMLPGIFIGSFAANAMLFAPPLYVTTIISLTNALGPVIGAMALRRLRPSVGLFTSFVGVIVFVLCTTLLSPAISAAGGALAMAIGQPLDPSALYSRWVTWWLTDSGGSLYLAPALILWLGLERESESHTAFLKQYLRRSNLAVWTWIAVVSTILFLTPSLHTVYIRAAFPFLLVVPLSWIALRMSLRSAYSLITLVAVVATAGTVAGVGPFQGTGLVNPLQLVGTLVVLLAMNVLTIVALVSERQEAQNANKVKAMFLANTSHELRTPLNAIIGFSSLLESEALGPIGNQQYADYSRLIHSSGTHLLTLINGLLDMSKIEAGRFALQEKPLSLDAAIEDAIGLIRLQAQAQSVALVIDPANADLTLSADAQAMRQILLNLLSNAVKFTPAGGRIELAVRRGPRGEAVIRVSDSGVGIPPNALDRVFHPFERAENAAKTIGGTGLGLSITRGLVLLHGGTIALDSVVGQGTVATVTLPSVRVLAQGGADALISSVA